MGLAMRRFLRKLQAWAGWGADAKRVRGPRVAGRFPLADPAARQAFTTVAIAALVVLSGFGMWMGVREAPPATAPMEVQASSEGPRLILAFDAVAVGATAVDGTTESVVWKPLHPVADPVDLAPGPETIAHGEAPDGTYTDIRLQFAWASVVLDDTVQDLVIPQNTLRVRVPGEAGAPGDVLKITIDASQSLKQEGDLLGFYPFVSDASWDKKALLDDEDGDATGGGGGGGAGSGDDGDRAATGPDDADDGPPQQLRSDEPPGYDAGDSSDDPGTPWPPSTDDGPEMGIVTLYARDAQSPIVERLEVEIVKVGLSVPGDDEKAFTYFEGSRKVDLVQYDGPDDRAQVSVFQLPARDFSALHIEFAATADGRINGEDRTVVVPQPVFVVERPFDVAPNGAVALLADFSISESLVLGGDGWEFRPVVTQYQVSDKDTDGDGIADPHDPDDDNDGIPDNKDGDRDGDGVPDERPSQYRVGGPALPSIGQSNKNRLQATAGFDWDERTRTLERAVVAPEGKNRPATAPRDDGGVSVDDPGSTTIPGTDDATKDVERIADDPKKEAARILEGSLQTIHDTSITVPASAPQTGREYLILETQRGLTGTLDAALATAGAEVVASLDTLNVLLVDAPTGARERLADMPGVLGVDPNRDIPLHLDTARSVTKALRLHDGSATHRAPDGTVLDGSGVGIGVIDSGIDATHPDLHFRHVVRHNYKFFLDRTEEMADTDLTSGHGTHVAGAAAGRGSISGTYTGMAPDATVYGLGTGDGVHLFFVLQAMDWVIQNHDKVSPPIRVVSNAWGSAAYQYDASSLESRFIDLVVDEGIVMVFAAGNDGGTGSGDTTTAECNHPRAGVICVGAYDDRTSTSPTGAVWKYSSRGALGDTSTWPDLVAPGHKITAPLALTGATAAEGVLYESPNLAYATLSGSSMATGVATGAVALLLEYDPSLTPADVERLLTETAYAFDGGPTDRHDRGHGLLDIEAAVAKRASE